MGIERDKNRLIQFIIQNIKELTQNKQKKIIAKAEYVLKIKLCQAIDISFKKKKINYSEKL